MPQGVMVLESYYRACEGLPWSEIGKIFIAICKFAFDGEETELSGKAKLIYTLILPNVEKSLKRYAICRENGAKGGRPSSTKGENQSAFSEENHEKEKEKEKEKEMEMEKETDMEMDMEKDSSQKKSKKKSPPDIFFSFACGDEILLKALRDFEEMRRLKKKPMTDRAKEMLCNKLKTFPPEEREATLLQSIEHGWDTVYSLHEEAGKGTDNPFLKMLEEF